MKDLLGKLSSYNIFNYLLPGIIFSILVETFTSFHLLQKDIINGVFLYYFIGLVISRIGSIIIEPLLKSTNFVHFSHYPYFVSASKKDDKLEILSESNNMYRTFCSLFLLLILLKVYERISTCLPQINKWNAEVTVIGLLILFLFSYRKQNNYITKRVNQFRKSEGDKDA